MKKDDNYIVFIEVHKNGNMERWFYAVCDNYNTANKTAFELSEHRRVGIFYRICKVSDASKYNINNIPDYVKEM